MGKATQPKRRGVSTTDTAAAAKARKAAILRAEQGVDRKVADGFARKSYDSGMTRRDLATGARGIIGNGKAETPGYAGRYNVARRAYMMGAIAAYLTAKGDNRGIDDLLVAAGTILDSAKPDAAKVADNQRRCTDAEWKARGAVRQSWSLLCSDFGIDVPKTAGGGANNSRGAGANTPKTAEEIVARASETTREAVGKLIAKAKRSANKEAREALQFAPPSNASDVEAFGEYVERMAFAMFQRCDKVNAATRGAVPPALGSAIADFRDAVNAARGK